MYPGISTDIVLQSHTAQECGMSPGSSLRVDFRDMTAPITINVQLLESGEITSLSVLSSDNMSSIVKKVCEGDAETLGPEFNASKHYVKYSEEGSKNVPFCQGSCLAECGIETDANFELLKIRLHVHVKTLTGKELTIELEPSDSLSGGFEEEDQTGRRHSIGSTEAYICK